MRRNARGVVAAARERGGRAAQAQVRAKCHTLHDTVPKDHSNYITISISKIKSHCV